MISDTDCKVCLMPDSQKPMCFRMTSWCCDDHRKVIMQKLTPLDPAVLVEATVLMHYSIYWRFAGSHYAAGFFPRHISGWEKLVQNDLEREERARR